VAEAAGLQPVVDFKKLKAGQNWNYEIKLAFTKSSMIVVLLSKNSVDHRGYVQRELRLALDRVQEMLVDDIYIIPVLIDDDVKIPDQLKEYQYVAACDPKYREAIADSISHQLERLGVQRQRVQRERDLYWKSVSIREEWAGLPGYAVDMQVLEFTSDTYSNVAQIGQFLRGHMLEILFSSRRNKLEQSVELHNYAQDKWARTNTFDAHCGEPVVKGKIVTLNYLTSWYGAGAAHPTHGHETFAFLLDPLVLISSLSSLFVEPEAAFPIVQKEVREALLNLRLGDEDGNPDDLITLDAEWINPGTEKWSDFNAFVFSNDSVDIFFSSYQVGPYVIGTPHVSVPYAKLAKLMLAEYVEALEIWRHARD
jgi:hypothetical protein